MFEACMSAASGRMLLSTHVVTVEHHARHVTSPYKTNDVHTQEHHIWEILTCILFLSYSGR